MTTYRDSQPYLVLESEGDGTVTVRDKYGEHIADIVLQFDGSLVIRDPEGNYLERETRDESPQSPGIVLGFNITDPANPLQISEIITTNNSVGAMDIYGDYLYFVEGFQTVLNKVNIEENPALIVTTFDMPESTAHEPFNISVHNGYAYFEGAMSGTYALGVDSPAELRELKEIYLPFSSEFAFQEQYVFTTGPMAGIVIGDVSEPGEIEQVSQIEAIYPDAMEPVGDRLYALNAGSLQIFDISDIESPSRLGSYVSFGRPESIIFNGDYIYVLDFESGWLVLDNSDPSNPILEKTVYIRSASDFEIHGDYAYTTAYPGINIVDISHPSDPVLVGVVDFRDRPTAIAYSDGYVFTVDGMSADVGIKIFDVKNPASPVEVLQLPIPGKCYDIEIRDGYAYIANYEQGVTIVDVRTPTLAYIKDTIQLNDQPTMVEIYENLVLATGQDSMFTVLRINSPGECEKIGELILTSRAYNLFTDEGYVYLSSNNELVRVIDIDPPGAMAFTDPIDVGFSAMSFQMDGKYCYIKTNESEFHILELP